MVPSIKYAIPVLSAKYYCPISASCVVPNVTLAEKRMAAIAVKPITLIASPNVGEVVNIISKIQDCVILK